MIRRILKVITFPIWLPIMICIALIDVFYEAGYQSFKWIKTGDATPSNRKCFMARIWKAVWGAVRPTEM